MRVALSQNEMDRNHLWGFIPTEDCHFIKYKRDLEHETRVLITTKDMFYVCGFQLIMDSDDYDIMMVCVPPGVCVACVKNHCWFHEPGASKTYYELLYECGHGTVDLKDFYAKLESFSRAKGLRKGNHLILNSEYPHEHIIARRTTSSIFTFSYRLLPRAPVGVISALVDAQWIPSKQELEEHATDIIHIACGNPDPYGCMLQYLVQHAKLVTFVPHPNLLALARTEQTMRFLLENGCNCKGNNSHVVPQFVHPYMSDREKHKILRALLEHGADFPLERWAFIDLESFRVIEAFRSREEICAWIDYNHTDIYADRDFHLAVWPYVCTHYGLRFTPEEFEWSLLCCTHGNDGDGDFERADTDMNRPGFVFTYTWARKTFRCVEGIDFIFARLATLLNCNNPSPFVIAPNLAILDRHLIWNAHTTRHFSRTLKRRLFAFLCVVRRMIGSTRAMKHMLPVIVDVIKTDSGGVDEYDDDVSGMTCGLQ
jgi:hypothetical protein